MQSDIELIASLSGAHHGATWFCNKCDYHAGRSLVVGYDNMGRLLALAKECLALRKVAEAAVALEQVSIAEATEATQLVYRDAVGQKQHELAQIIRRQKAYGEFQRAIRSLPSRPGKGVGNG